MTSRNQAQSGLSGQGYQGSSVSRVRAEAAPEVKSSVERGFPPPPRIRTFEDRGDHYQELTEVELAARVARGGGVYGSGVDAA